MVSTRFESESGTDASQETKRKAEISEASTDPVAVVDPVGAGDAFVGGFLAGRLRGLDDQRCLKLANACSDDQLSVLVRVVGYGDIEVQIERPVRAFEIALDLGTMGFMYHTRRLNWPSLANQNDGWIFDLAFTSGADYIVTYDNAVHSAAERLGFRAVYPEDLLGRLRRQYES